MCPTRTGRQIIIIEVLLIYFVITGIFWQNIKEQDDLMDLLSEENDVIDYAYATFKTTRVINSHSVEQPANGVLLFLIQHRFGRLNTGLYELFGLDQATVQSSGVGDLNPSHYLLVMPHL